MQSNLSKRVSLQSTRHSKVIHQVKNKPKTSYLEEAQSRISNIHMTIKYQAEYGYNTCKKSIISNVI